MTFHRIGNRMRAFALIALAIVLSLSLAPRADAALLTLTTLDENASIVNISGLAAAASVGGDTFVNDGNTFLYVKNASGSSITVTIAPQITTVAPAGGQGVLTKASVTDTIATGNEGLLGPFPQTFFNNSAGQVSVTYSAVTTVTVAPVRLARH